MPLFSDHISNIYYSGSPLYSSSSYGYSSSVLPLGSSYSASYLNPGSSYSNHSSLGGYSRTPLTSRWISGVGRSYSPMLSTISERSTGTPVRINSPRRIPITKRNYGSSGYITRPININTADIDVSKDKYRKKAESSVTSLPQRKESPRYEREKENSPFMPRVDGKPETGIDSSPGISRNTIKRGRTVVRLHTIRRKERDSPRKPTQSTQNQEETENIEKTVPKVTQDFQIDTPESTSWRERLSDDLVYKDKKAKKTLGTKLAEKFMVKEDNHKDDTLETVFVEKTSPETKVSQCLPVTPFPSTSKSLDRRCSLEILAEQAQLLDSLIRKENLSTAPLDLSKIGVLDESKNDAKSFGPIKRRKSNDKHNPLKTTQSDHSLHDSVKSAYGHNSGKNLSKRRSLKKSSSGGSICRLDSITELPKEPLNINLPEINETKTEATFVKPKPKLKNKITASVEVTSPKSPLKFRIENVIVEEKPRIIKKEITFSSTVDEIPLQNEAPLKKEYSVQCQETQNDDKLTKKIQPELSSTEPCTIKKEITFSSAVDEIVPQDVQDSIQYEETQNNNNTQLELSSPEPNDGNFWSKIGKRETIYLLKRKEIIHDAKEKHKRPFYWHPNEGTFNENDAAEHNDATQEDSGVTNIITADDNIHSKNKTSAIKSTTQIIEPECILDTIPKAMNNNSLKTIDTTEISEDSLKNHKTYQQVNTTEKTSLNDDISKNKNEIDLSHQDDNTVEKESKICDLKDTVINKEINILPQQENELANKIIDSNNKKGSSKITKTKELSLSDEVVTTTKVWPIKEEMKNKESPPKDASKKKETKESARLKVVVNHKVPTKLSQKEEQASKTKYLKQSSHEINKMQPVESTTGKPTSSEVCTQQTETDINILKRDSERNAEKLQLNENKTEAPIKETVSKMEIYGKLNNAKEQDLNINVHNMVDTSDKLHKKSETDQEQKLSKVKEVQPKTKSASNKLESSKKNDSSKKSASDKIGEKKNSISPEKSLNETKLYKDNIEGKTTELKINEQDIQNSPFAKPATEVKTCAIVEELNNKLIGENNQESLILNKNITQKQGKPPASHIKVESSSFFKKSGDVNVLSCNNIPEIQVPIEESENIPSNINEVKSVNVVQEAKEAVNNVEAETALQKDEQEAKQPTVKDVVVKFPDPPSAKKHAKPEAALRPLIATPRPLQKRAPQVIHSSESSDSSSEEESSDEEDDECDASEGSEEFFECEVNPDGRTSTGSNDSGFDSSAPTSPAGFQQIRKDCDVNCHRKCEKLTANLCGVNQRLLVEALATRTASKKGADVPGTSTNVAVHNNNSTDILEQELEQSTAYGIFRKTGRFTPPARSIPRFRKYTVEDFNFIKVLGKGSFGKVLLAELRDTEYYYAVKCLKKDVVLEDDDVECTLIERKVLALGTNHPYLCHLFATFQSDSHLFFVMEYLNGGDLMFHIQQSGRFPETRARFYAAEIVSGLKFLHKRGIIYRDLKLDNILLDFDGHVRIADFGMCKLQIYLDKTADTFCGTPDYMAPEIIKGLKYNQTVDWWSFGVLLYEMLIGQSPFSGCDEDELFWSICNEMPSYPRFLSQEALTILTRLLDKDARTRLGGTECMHGDIKEQVFFHSIHWDRLERRDLEAPFRPRVRHPLDTQYFDRAFTGERPRLTAVEPQVLRSMDQEPFRGFSYTNPNATDR